MKDLEPVYTTDLFPKLDAELIKLLSELSADDWNKQTICSLWNVKDVAAHLLDTSIRRLAICRDNYFGEKPENINSYKDLVDYLNDQNADWVRAAKRISPNILIALLEQTGREAYEFFKSLDPHGPAPFSVAWAGEEVSENWFDIAREYTERWHHQQQIRLAVQRPGIMSRELYFPVLDAFMRALPHAYKDVSAGEGTMLKFQITGEAGGNWYLLKQNQNWKLGKDAEGPFTSETVIGQEIAWRIFTKGTDRESARNEIKIIGDKTLGGEILSMLAVMAYRE